MATFVQRRRPTLYSMMQYMCVVDVLSLCACVLMSHVFFVQYDADYADVDVDDDDGDDADLTNIERVSE